MMVENIATQEAVKSLGVRLPLSLNLATGLRGKPAPTSCDGCPVLTGLVLTAIRQMRSD
jgi:hypothetical protein